MIEQTSLSGPCACVAGRSFWVRVSWPVTPPCPAPSRPLAAFANGLATFTGLTVGSVTAGSYRLTFAVPMLGWGYTYDFKVTSGDPFRITMPAYTSGQLVQLDLVGSLTPQLVVNVLAHGGGQPGDENSCRAFLRQGGGTSVVTVVCHLLPANKAWGAFVGG